MHVSRLYVAFALIGLVSGGSGDSSVYAQVQAMPAITAPGSLPAPYGYPSPVSSPASSFPAQSPISVPSDPAAAGVSPYDSAVTPAQYSNPPGTGYMANDLGASPAGGNGGLDAAVGSKPLDTNSYIERVLTGDETWTYQIAPPGLMYKSYLAGTREPRFGCQWDYIKGQNWVWDVTLGGRAALIRLGTENDLWPQGWQLDIEGAAFPRLDDVRDLVDCDYRFGLPLTTRQGMWESKFGYYHLSSHIGDEYLLKNPGFPRINYVRESLVWGVAMHPNPNWRLYSEVGYAFYVDGGAQPWEFQFGFEFSPAEPTNSWGAPFFAVNGHLRQENAFGGNVSIETGWQWRGRTGHLCRIGAHYFNGMSDQYQFFQTFEDQLGFGLWYDF